METVFLEELTAALEVATLAGEYILREYQSFVVIPDAPADISTDIDRGSQDLILNYLKQRFPNDGLCAEEQSTLKTAGTSKRVWVVDPIDGTRGFVKKNGEFSVMIGLTVNGKPVVGVVLEPVTMTTTYARTGGGCWVKTPNSEPTRCHVRTESDLAKCVLVQSHTTKPSMPVMKLTPGSVREMYSAGVKMAVVARGEADLYANTYQGFSDWDICAGHILVTEAGGVISGLKGETITYGNDGFKQVHGLIAASAACHARAIEKLI